MSHVFPTKKAPKRADSLALPLSNFAYKKLSNYEVQENRERVVKGTQQTQNIGVTLHLFLWGKLVLNYATFELRGVFKDNPRLRWDRTSQQAFLSLEVVS